jgi:hypothetical protein
MAIFLAVLTDSTTLLIDMASTAFFSGRRRQGFGAPRGDFS